MKHERAGKEDEVAVKAWAGKLTQHIVQVRLATYLQAAGQAVAGRPRRKREGVHARVELLYAYFV